MRVLARVSQRESGLAHDWSVSENVLYFLRHSS